MQKQNHPWVQDFTSYEAVLCCVNEVGEWDAAATLRAYQTYGFDDATTKGNDQSFRHIETGVLLLHDGEVVAIQFGDGNLKSALADLFQVLHCLGWRIAEVYHAAETLGALMNDMGNAIPGHMDFDVRAAKELADTDSLPPEATEMIQLGASLMQNVAATPQEAQNFHALTLDTLSSMGPDHEFEATMQGGGTRAVPAAGPVHLDGELEVNFGDERLSFTQPTFSHNPPMSVRGSEQVFLDDFDALPVVPVLGGFSPQPGPEPVLSVHDFGGLSSQETLDEPLASESDQGHDELMDPDVPVEVDDKVLLHEPVLTPTAPHPIRQEQVAIAAPLEQVARSAASETMPSLPQMPNNVVGLAGAQIGSFIRVGNSALGFDMPDNPLSLDDVDQLAAKIGTQEVVHVWPGLVDQAERWDLIGEIDTSAPWFAEVVANVLEVQKPIERVWFAAALIQLAKHQKGAQLRDLLTKMSRGDQEIFNGAEAWFSAFKTEDVENFKSSVHSRFAGLLLSESGEAFLDIQPAEGGCVRPFSVRSMVESPEPKLYVVHLDAADGPFVEMTTNLLMTVAHRYSISTRARTQAQALQHETERRESTQREAARLEALEQAKATMALLQKQLQTAGLSLPAEGLALPA